MFGAAEATELFAMRDDALSDNFANPGKGCEFSGSSRVEINSRRCLRLRDGSMNQHRLRS